MTTESLDQQLERFAGVMKARRTPTDIIELVNKLKTSTLFTEDAKPHCLVALLKDATTRLPDRHLPALLDTLARATTVQELRQKLPKAVYLPAFAHLTKRVIAATPFEVNAFMESFLLLMAANIADSPGDVGVLLLDSGQPLAYVDRILLTCHFAIHPKDADNPAIRETVNAQLAALAKA